MKSNKEIRKEARGIVRGAWFWRILSVTSLLYAVVILISLAIRSFYAVGEIQTWTDFWEAKMAAIQSGLDYAVPSKSIAWQMTSATFFEQFISFIFGAILAFGMASLMLKAVSNDEKGWFSCAFSGFKRPLELAWLLFLMNLRIFLWTILLFVPGLIAIYRYRQAWYLKSENPDWSATRCLAESGRMMKGQKWKAFCLDFSFLGWAILIGIVWSLIILGFANGNEIYGNSLLLVFLGVALSIVCFYFVAFFAAYVFVARAVFYKDLAHASQN